VALEREGERERGREGERERGREYMCGSRDRAHAFRKIWHYG